MSALRHPWLVAAKEEVVGVEILFLSKLGVDTDKLDFKHFALPRLMRWSCGKHRQLRVKKAKLLSEERPQGC